MKIIPTVHFTLVRHGAASKKVFEYPSGHFFAPGFSVFSLDLRLLRRKVVHPEN